MSEAQLMAAWWTGVERVALVAWLKGEGTFEEWAVAAYQAKEWGSRDA